MNTAPAPSNSRCPRCGGEFHCGAGEPAPCACSGLQLDPTTLARIAARFQGCLCLRCLADVAAADQAGASEAPRAASPSSIGPS